MAKKESSSGLGKKKKRQLGWLKTVGTCQDKSPIHPIKAGAPAPERPVLGADPTD